MTTWQLDIDFLLALALFGILVTGKSEFVFTGQFLLNFLIAQYVLFVGRCNMAGQLLFVSTWQMKHDFFLAFVLFGILVTG